jgi:hypothetical protein
MEQAARSPGGAIVVTAACLALFGIMISMPVLGPRLLRGRGLLIRFIALEAFLLAVAVTATLYVIACIDLGWSGGGLGATRAESRRVMALNIMCCFCVPWCIFNMWLLWQAKKTVG